MNKSNISPAIKVTKSPFPRGKMINLTMEIEYPDGQMKTVEYRKEWLEGTSALLLDESCMSEGQLREFWGTEDWEDNPTFLRLKKPELLSETETLKCLDNGQACDHCCYYREHAPR